ncbi:hypothetical protein AAFF_G00430930 [Aldrovandia affinis]|uniref:Interferon-induced protein 44-like n=1 Tax=Aldrovandia affinis TaxID=143900 RepID=A0AAD7R576_9TELE|nr:hypothetical protein AAFF_G00430930 [Aldrovandia affinis]
MGNLFSWFSSPVMENSCSEFSTPWREMSWSEREDTLEELRTFTSGNPNVGRLRILLNGPVGAGKSSFINSINNIFQGRPTIFAEADATGGKSFTKKYKTCFIENTDMPGSTYSFAFNDVMGLEGDHGVCTSDIINAMKGHIKEGYKFNPSSPLSQDDSYWYVSPSLEDQAHCLVTVVEANKIAIMNDDTARKLREIRLAANDLDIPHVVVVTKVDEFCPLVKEDLKRVYKCKLLKEKMEQLSSKVGIPMNRILSVKDYHEENILQDNVDELLLNALSQIVDYANEYVKRLAPRNQQSL